MPREWTPDDDLDPPGGCGGRDGVPEEADDGHIGDDDWEAADTGEYDDGGVGMVPCPECGREIADFVDKCPHCGNWVDQGGDTSPHMSFRAVALMLLLIVVVCTTGLFFWRC